MANEETFIQEELLKLGQKQKKWEESVIFTAYLLPPHHQNLQLISSALLVGVAKTQSFPLPQLPIKKQFLTYLGQVINISHTFQL